MPNITFFMATPFVFESIKPQWMCQSRPTQNQLLIKVALTGLGMARGFFAILRDENPAMKKVTSEKSGGWIFSGAVDELRVQRLLSSSKIEKS
jgi:hypothetical protein